MPLQLTLQQLAQIALGGPQINKINIVLLHSLFDILLKKLDCQNETVALVCPNNDKDADTEDLAECLKYLLSKSKISPLPFEDENLKIISDKSDRIDKLEQLIDNLEKNLETHLQEVEEKKAQPDGGYTCENMCSIPGRHNVLACMILRNTDFLNYILGLCSGPMIARMKEYEAKLKTLEDEFAQLVERTRYEFEHVLYFESCVEDVIQICDQVRDRMKKFLLTMEEVQDMIDAKVDKIHMIPLKKYLSERFEHIDNIITKMRLQSECPRAAGIIMTKGEQKPKGTKSKRVRSKQKATCGCEGVCALSGEEPSLLDRINLMKSSEVLDHLIAVVTDRRSCKLPESVVRHTPLDEDALEVQRNSV